MNFDSLFLYTITNFPPFEGYMIYERSVRSYLFIYGFSSSFILEFIALILAMFMNFIGGRFAYKFITRLIKFLNEKVVLVHIYRLKMNFSPSFWWLTK